MRLKSALGRWENMAANISAGLKVEPIESMLGRQRIWPSAARGYWALTVIILATFLTFFDQVVFGMLAERIKADFGLTDSQLGFLAGPASIICYFFVGIPLARMADLYPRKYVLAGSAVLVGFITALGGVAQNFGQFLATRVFLAAGGSAHAPSSYSLLADAFPPHKITRAFALLQLGFIGGISLGPIIGGMLIVKSASWAPTQIAGLTILGWQWILIWLGLPGLLVGLLFLTIKEPGRAVSVNDAAESPQEASFGRKFLTFTGLDAAKAIASRGKVYYPLFGGLALSAVQVFGIQFWTTPFLMRTYGWNEGKIGAMLGVTTLIASLIGITLGGVFVEWLAKRYKDANVRAAAIFFAGVTVVNICAPLMPNGYAAIATYGVGIMFGLAGAVPQNAAIQRIAPNAMRGQVTAIYLFMFIFFGAMGSYVIGLVQQYIVGVEQDLWKSMVITSVVLLPIATFLMYKAIRPYREEVERLDALEKGSL
jgi:MFS family permease